MVLTAVQARVLGSLIEKGITTPEQYPLSLNALRNACNQSSSREPVMSLDEDEVRQALHSLDDLGFTAVNHDARVPKFEEQARHRLQLRRDEIAVLCLLLLRGPQTPGELRTRSERLHAFDDPAGVVAALERLSRREISAEHPDGPLVVQLARQPGSHEARWVTTLTKSLANDSSSRPYPNDLSSRPESARDQRDDAAERPASPATTGAITSLAEELSALRAEVNELRERLDRLEGR